VGNAIENFPHNFEETHEPEGTEYTIDEDESRHCYRSLLRAGSFEEIDTIINKMDENLVRQVLTRFARGNSNLSE